MALGEFGLLPWEFEALTPADLRLIVRGRRRLRNEWAVRAAGVLARCLSPFLKEPITGCQLLGWPDNWWAGDD